MSLTYPCEHRHRPELEALEGRDLPSTLSGVVFADTNYNGTRDTGETGIARVTITLTGTTKKNQSVHLTQTTDAGGTYTFTGLQAGTYTLTETQPADYLLGQATAGNLGGSGGTGTGTITGITVNTTDGSNYNFADLPAAARGGQGLPRTYWQQPQNNGVWQTYSPDQSFNAVFGVSVPGNPTLLQALQAKGGGVAALERQAVAALLNAASPDVDYLYSVDQVISMVQKAYESGHYAATIRQLDAQNNQGVPKHSQTATLSGFVAGTSEQPLAGVVVALSTTDSHGKTVTVYTTTDSNGFYKFAGLAPGTYTLTVFMPTTGNLLESVGTVNGARDGSASPTSSRINGITLAAGNIGVNYDFTQSQPSQPPGGGS